jgi:NAD+ kinase
VKAVKVLGMIINARKPEAVEMGRRLLTMRCGAEVLLPMHEASVLSVEGVSDEDWLRTVEVALVIGGDGTFLRASRYVLEAGVPLYGINLGRLGFLASGRPEDAEADVARITAGECEILERPILRCEVRRETNVMHTLHALNDFVLTKNAIARLLRIEARINDRFFGVLPADGIIISSPTGSTAYALSAGGPIVPPNMRTMLMAPICAHTLYSRPLLAAPDDTITLIPKGSIRDITLTQDGQLAYEVLPDDRIEISLSKDKAIRTVSMPGRNFFDLVQEKLGWGLSFRGEYD